MEKILFVGESVYNLLGYLPQEFVEGGMQFFAKKIHPGDYPEVMRDYLYTSDQIRGKSGREKAPFSGSCCFRLLHADNEWRFLKNEFIVLDYNQDGSIGRVFGVIKLTSDLHENNENVLLKNSGYDHDGPFTPMLVEGDDGNSVSKREKEVLELIARGFSSKMIADKLFISEHTATSHRKNLITKFQVKNTAELIRVASKYYWL